MKKKITMKQKIAFSLVLLSFVCILVLFWHINTYKESKFDSIILRASRQYQVSPYLIKAVIWKESRFNPNATGTVGERGLMQIRPLTAKEWCQDNKIPPFNPEHLYNPLTNIMIGTWYLGKMLKRYADTDDPLPYALSDYNAGRVKVLQWNQGAASTNSAQFIENITYPSPRNYFISVRNKIKDYE